MSPSALTSFLGEWVGNPTQAVVRRSRWQQPSGKWIAEVLKKHCLITVYVLGASALEKGKVWLEMIHKKQTKKMFSFASNTETTHMFTSPKTFQFLFT